jgi:hypothetical protein
MHVLQRAYNAVLDPLRSHRRDLLLANAAYFGLVLAGAVVSALNPLVQRTLLQSVQQGFSTGLLSVVAGAYLGQNVPLAIALTFGVNLLLGTALALTLPSLLLPFAGVAVALVRAFTWGLLFAPTSRELALAMVPHAGTMLLEGEAYVIAMMGVLLLWRDVLWPRAAARAAVAGASPAARTSRWETYVEGVRLNLRLYVPIVALLLLAAVYEVLELLYVVPRLIGGA